MLDLKDLKGNSISTGCRVILTLMNSETSSRPDHINKVQGTLLHDLNLNNSII